MNHKRGLFVFSYLGWASGDSHLRCVEDELDGKRLEAGG